MDSGFESESTESLYHLTEPSSPYPLHDACEDTDVEVLKNLLGGPWESYKLDNESITKHNDRNNVKYETLNGEINNSRKENTTENVVAINSSDILKIEHTFAIKNKDNSEPNPTLYHCPLDVNERDDDGNTPLHVAIHARHLEHMSLLLQSGASPLRVCDGSSPIHTCISIGAIVKHQSFSYQAVRILEKYGADVTVRDDSLQTPLSLSVRYCFPKLVEWLVSHKFGKETINRKCDRVGGRPLHVAARFDVRKHDSSGEYPSTTFILLHLPGIDKECQDHYGRTPIHIAAKYGNWHVVRMLVEAGVCVTRADQQTRTPGMIACKRGLVIPEDVQNLLKIEKLNIPCTLTSTKTLLLSHDLCLRHYTCPPLTRTTIDDPPPENIRRLSVLLHPDVGILRSQEFRECLWEPTCRRAAISDILKVHEYPYVEQVSYMCSQLSDSKHTITSLDDDTSVSYWSFEAALHAAGSVCQAIDRVVSGDVRNGFCVIRPPGHHAGPRGSVTCPNDPEGSQGFCLLNNVAIGAAYARNLYRHQGVQKVAIVDFDVHHGNGTEEIIRRLIPRIDKATVSLPFVSGKIQTSSYRPWLDETDIDHVLFASTHGYGPRDAPLSPCSAPPKGWFYPASGKSLTSEALSQPMTRNSSLPPIRDFLLSQSWMHATDDSLTHTCKVINVGFDLPTSFTTPGMQRIHFRDAYRTKILPQLMKFDPDLLLISAGFDGHRRDTMNFGYLGIVEEDYEWITEQLVQVANACCDGRIVSVLEGGYKIHGGIVSPFARSVASHVRVLQEGGIHREIYDGQSNQWESEFEHESVKGREKIKQQRQVEKVISETKADSMKLADKNEVIPKTLIEPSTLSITEGCNKRRRMQVEYNRLYEKLKQEKEFYG